MGRFLKYGKLFAGSLIGAALAKSLNSRYNRRAAPVVPLVGNYQPGVQEFLGYTPDTQVEFSGQGKYKVNAKRRYRRRAVVRKSTRSKMGIKELSKRLAFVASLAGAAGFGGYYGKRGAQYLADLYDRGDFPDLR